MDRLSKMGWLAVFLLGAALAVALMLAALLTMVGALLWLGAPNGVAVAVAFVLTLVAGLYWIAGDKNLT